MLSVIWAENYHSLEKHFKTPDVAIDYLTTLKHSDVSDIPGED